MKYFTASVNTTLDGEQHFTPIQFLTKRHRSKNGAEWEYTVKIGYVESLDNVNNKPYHFRLAGDWTDAIQHIFERQINSGSSKLEILMEITI